MYGNIQIEDDEGATYLVGGPRAQLALRELRGDILGPALLALAVGEVRGERVVELGADQAPILLVFTGGRL